MKFRYFPFAPGIPWAVRAGRWVEPTLQHDVWHGVLDGRDAVVVCHGGLIESYFSLTYLEMLNCLAPDKKIYWSGDKQFNRLIWMNGLGNMNPTEFTKKMVSSYPLPLFLDGGNFFYLNVLNNYQRVISIDRLRRRKKYNPILIQMFANTTLATWDDSFLPQMRNNATPAELKTWLGVNKFHLNKPYVCIFPDRGQTIHEFSGLDWNDSQIKALAAQLGSMQVNLLVFTDRPNRFHNSQVHVLPERLDFILALLPMARAVLSETVDYLLIAGMVGNAALVANPNCLQFNLRDNLSFINRTPLIYTSWNLTPTQVIDFLVNGAEDDR